MRLIIVSLLLVAYGSMCSSPQLEYKKGHEERISKYTAFVDPPEVLLAKKQGQIVSDVSSFKLNLFD